MQFTIRFLLNNNTSITSGAVIQNPSIYQTSFLERSDLSCTIQLHLPSGIWEIEDELPVLAAHFFLRSVKKLSSASLAKYEYFEHYGQVNLELIDNQVCISGDFVDDLMLEFSLFKTLSVELGKQAVELLEKLDHQKFQADLEFIRQPLFEVIDCL